MSIIRPIVFLDLETTGTNPREDRIVSIAAIRMEPDFSSDERHYLINPGCPIPAEATAVHGITDAMVKDQPKFARYAEGFLEYIGAADLGGYNIRRFDLPLLHEELGRAGKAIDLRGRRVIDGQTIFFHQHPRDLAAAVQTYVGVELKDAHDALTDTRAARDVLLAQMEGFPPLETEDGEDVVAAMGALCDEVSPLRISEMERWFEKNPTTGQLAFRQGKHSGKLLADVAGGDSDTRSYLEWLLRKVPDAEVQHVVASAQLAARGAPQRNVAPEPDPQQPSLL